MMLSIGETKTTSSWVVPHGQDGGISWEVSPRQRPSPPSRRVRRKRATRPRLHWTVRTPSGTESLGEHLQEWSVGFAATVPRRSCSANL